MCIRDSPETVCCFILLDATISYHVKVLICHVNQEGVDLEIFSLTFGKSCLEMNGDVALDRSVLSNIRSKGQIGLRGGFADCFITVSDLNTCLLYTSIFNTVKVMAIPEIHQVVKGLTCDFGS